MAADCETVPPLAFSICALNAVVASATLFLNLTPTATKLTVSLEAIPESATL